jgi:D-alanyl-D-alanine carboxypeptidase
MVVTKAEPASEPKPKAAEKVEARLEPKAEAKPGPRFAVASAVSVPAHFSPSAAPAEPARSESIPAPTLTHAGVIVGSTEPIHPVLVKTLTVRAGMKTASLVPLQVASPAAEAHPAPAAAPAAAAAPAKPEALAPSSPVRTVKPDSAAPAPAAMTIKSEPTAPPATPVAVAKSEPAPASPAATPKAEPAPSGPAAVRGEPPASAAVANPEPAAATKTEAAAIAPTTAANPELSTPPVAAAAPTPVVAAAKVAPPLPAARPASPTPAAKTAAAATKHGPGWMIQVGAYPAEQAARQRLSSVQSKASKILTGAEAFTETVDKGGTTYYRARFAGLDKDKAEAACKYLKKNDVDCVTIKN